MQGWYYLLMRSERNSLNVLPPAQRFQIMVFLSLMWTTIFTASTTLWVWYGELLIGHLLLAMGVLVTSCTFRIVKSLQSFSMATR